MLGLWVGVGVLSAGFIAHLPEIHAELHHHHHADHSHDHDHDRSNHTPDHQCLIQALSDGGASPASLALDCLVVRLSSATLQLLETQSRIASVAFLLPPGRAPPVV